MILFDFMLRLGPKLRIGAGVFTGDDDDDDEQEPVKPLMGFRGAGS